MQLCAFAQQFQIGKILSGYECGYVLFAFLLSWLRFVKKNPPSVEHTKIPRWYFGSDKSEYWFSQRRLRGGEHDPIKICPKYNLCSAPSDMFIASVTVAIWVQCFMGFRPYLTVNVKVTVDLMVRPTSYGQAKSLVTVGLQYLRVHWVWERVILIAFGLNVLAWNQSSTTLCL